MSGFGHKITSATQRDRDFYNKPRGEIAGRFWPAIGCCWPKCHRPEVVYVTSYRYVTGRAGRVSLSEKFVCEEHGRKFATKHGLEAPDPSIPGDKKSVSQEKSEFITGALAALSQ